MCYLYRVYYLYRSVDGVDNMCVNQSFFFQAEDGIRDLVRSRGLGDVYKRQIGAHAAIAVAQSRQDAEEGRLTRAVRSHDGGHLALSLIHI